jgi:glucosylceramidase
MKHCCSAGRYLTGVLLAFGCVSGDLVAETGTNTVRWWLTTADRSKRLVEQSPLALQPLADAPRGDFIQINPSVSYQVMLGLGSSLEPSTCSNLWRMTQADREHTIERLVSPTAGSGMNLMRVCIGTPDFTGDAWYSYDDLPSGETDPELRRFSIDRDRAYILPVLKLARHRNPDLLFFASPWSPPGWMKSTGSMVGGHLLPQWYPAYAEYFVKFIQAYEAEGMSIYSVTIQNEPGVDRAKERDPNWHYPSCHWTAEQERDFIRDHLGPAFRRHGLTTRIWCYDHNFNERPRGDDPGIAYPRLILSDPQAAAFVSGVAFHGYAGRPAGMSALHSDFPNVPIYFTEGSVFGLRGGVELIDILRNFASGYNAWVTILDDQGRPNNGPFEASRTIITLDPTTRRPTEHFDYDLYGHFMRFIQRGATRVASEGPRRLPNVAFRNPDGTLVLVVVRDGSSVRAGAKCGTMFCRMEMPGRSVATFVWAPSGQSR